MSKFKGAIQNGVVPPPRFEIPPFGLRPKRRRRVLYPGLIACASGELRLDCTIRNLTENGAHITVPRNAEFPSRFYLINIIDRLAHEAKVIWNIGVDAGVIYEKTYRLADIVDPSLHFLKEMRLARATH